MKQNEKHFFSPGDFNAYEVLLDVCYEIRCLLLYGHADRDLQKFLCDVVYYSKIIGINRVYAKLIEIVCT